MRALWRIWSSLPSSVLTALERALGLSDESEVEYRDDFENEAD